MPASAASDDLATMGAPAPRPSLQRLFEPHTVAVVGASRRRGTIGAEILHNLIADSFTGRVVPVNPRAGTIEGMQAYPSIRDVPFDIDLVVIAVPAAAVVPCAIA